MDGTSAVRLGFGFIMLKGKNIILTGASRGIGRAVLRLFAENHGNVWCLVRNPSEEFCSFLKDMEELYDVRLSVVVCDLSNEDSIKKAFSEIIKDGQDRCPGQ